MTRMVIGDDLSPHFLDDEGDPREQCDLCGRVMLDHETGVVVGGPTGWTEPDEEGWVYNAHIACIEAHPDLAVAGGHVWAHLVWNWKTNESHGRAYERVEDIEGFDYDEWYGKAARR
jgi:hypothetical protein